MSKNLNGDFLCWNNIYNMSGFIANKHGKHPAPHNLANYQTKKKDDQTIITVDGKDYIRLIPSGNMSKSYDTSLKKFAPVYEYLREKYKDNLSTGLKLPTKGKPDESDVGNDQIAPHIRAIREAFEETEKGWGSGDNCKFWYENIYRATPWYINIRPAQGSTVRAKSGKKAACEEAPTEKVAAESDGSDIESDAESSDDKNIGYKGTFGTITGESEDGSMWVYDSGIEVGKESLPPLPMSAFGKYSGESSDSGDSSDSDDDKESRKREFISDVYSQQLMLDNNKHPEHFVSSLYNNAEWKKLLKTDKRYMRIADNFSQQEKEYGGDSGSKTKEIYKKWRDETDATEKERLGKLHTLGFVGESLLKNPGEFFDEIEWPNRNKKEKEPTQAQREKINKDNKEKAENFKSTLNKIKYGESDVFYGDYNEVEKSFPLFGDVQNPFWPDVSNFEYIGDYRAETSTKLPNPKKKENFDIITDGFFNYESSSEEESGEKEEPNRGPCSICNKLVYLTEDRMKVNEKYCHEHCYNEKNKKKAPAAAPATSEALPPPPPSEARPPKPTIPPDNESWGVHWSKSKNKWYYFNTETNESTFTRPQQLKGGKKTRRKSNNKHKKGRKTIKKYKKARKTRRRKNAGSGKQTTGTKKSVSFGTGNRVSMATSFTDLANTLQKRNPALAEKFRNQALDRMEKGVSIPTIRQVQYFDKHKAPTQTQRVNDNKETSTGRSILKKAYPPLPPGVIPMKYKTPKGGKRKTKRRKNNKKKKRTIKRRK
jgi:hypothetical protein